RAWDVGDDEDLRGHVPRARLRADRVANQFLERGIERVPRLQLYKEDHARVALPVLAHDDALRDLLELLDDSIDLRGADPHAAGIQHGVRTSIDHEAVVLGELGVIAVTPDVREAREVRLVIEAPVRVVPETDRHRRERRGADELAFRTAQRAAVRVEDLDLHP